MINKMNRSWKTEVLTGNADWSSNSLRFATEEEAKQSGEELLSRWSTPRDSRAAKSDDPVNYKFDTKLYKNVPLTNEEKAVEEAAWNAKQQEAGT